MIIEIDSSDLLKIRDALREANHFFESRDEMNSYVHLAKEVRYSPITAIVNAAYRRTINLLGGEKIDD